MALLNLRWMRTHLSGWIPEPLKRRFRARLFGYGVPSVEPGTVEREGDEVRAEFRGVHLRAPAAAFSDLRYHLQDNGDSIEEMESVLRAAADPGGLLMDVGAARGVISAMFCLARPGNRAVAYEPAPAQADDVRRMAEMNGLGDRMEVIASAADASPSTITAGVDAMGLVNFSPSPDAETFAVEMVRLDDEVARIGIPSVVKIDVEGAEMDVLRGAESLLRTHHPVLLLELHLDLLEKRGVRPAEVADFLRGCGYRFGTCAGQPLAAPENSPKAVLRLVARPTDG